MREASFPSPWKGEGRVRVFRAFVLLDGSFTHYIRGWSLDSLIWTYLNFLQFIKNSMAIILPSSAYEFGIIGAEPVSNYIVSKRIILPVFCSVPFGLYYLTCKPANVITLQRQKSIRIYSFFSRTNTPHLNSHHADDSLQNSLLCSQKL